MSSSLSPASASRFDGTGLRLPLALLFGWFAAQVALRVLVSDSLELDEAEQMLATRTLALGYGAQPPLYTWIQYAFFGVFGVSVFSLALAKNAMLFAAWTFTLLAARCVMPARAAWLATLSMLWLVALSWDAQRDLTHTVLATTIAAAVAWAFVRVARHPGVAAHVVLGVAAGLAVLAKYNNVAFLVVLAGTAFVVPRLRRRVFSMRLAWAFAFAALVVAPHALWLLDHWQLASAGTLEKMGAEPGRTTPAAWLQGFASAALALVAFATPFWIVVLAFFGRRAWSGPVDASAARFARAWLLLFVAMLAAMVVFGGVTHFKPRWFVPGLFALPAMFFASRPALAEGARADAYRRTTLAFGVLLFVLLAAKVPVEGRYLEPGDLNEPIGALAAALRADGFERGVVVTGERRLAGRLRAHFPASTIVLAGERAPDRARGEPRLVVASGERIDALLARLGSEAAASRVRRIELPYLYGAQRPLRARYGWVVLDAGSDAGVRLDAGTGAGAEADASTDADPRASARAHMRKAPLSVPAAEAPALPAPRDTR